MLHRAYLLLGSNRGNRLEMLIGAAERIENHAGKIVVSSSVYETAPWGFHDETNFLNQVLGLETLLSPFDLLAELLRIETNIGRTRHGNCYSSRLIDIDILFFDDHIVECKHLTIPHPSLHKRRFTLLPLAEIAGDLIHPVLQLTVNELVLHCQDESEIKIYIPDPITQKIKTS